MDWASSQSIRPTVLLPSSGAIDKRKLISRHPPPFYADATSIAPYKDYFILRRPGQKDTISQIYQSVAY
jgi:hypothetical protein